MIATKQMDLRANIKKYFDLAFNGETIVVSRKENKNVVVISEQEYNELQRAKRNAEYLAKLDRSFAQLKQGEVVIKSMEELERMADYILGSARSLLRMHSNPPQMTTLSLGACSIGVGQDLEHWYTQADTALYRAKRLGGDRVEWQV